MNQQAEFFCGREDALIEVLELVGADNAQSVSVVGDPGYGRSAFLRELARVGESQLPSVFALLCLRGEEDGPESFLRLVGATLAPRCGPLQEDSTDLVLQEAIDAVRRREERLVLLCDDFHHLTMDPRYPPTFFESLRALASTEERFAIVTASFLPLDQMCSSVELAGSPFFNIFSTRRLGPLHRQDAAELLDGLCQQLRGSPADEDLDCGVWDLTGGCPLLVHLAARHLAAPGIPSSTGGDPSWEAALAAFLEEALAYFERIWALLSERERQLCLAATSERNTPQRVPVGLIARGLLAPRGKGKTCVPHCFAFKKFLVRKQGRDVQFVHPRRRGWRGLLRRGWRGSGDKGPAGPRSP